MQHPLPHRPGSLRGLSSVCLLLAGIGLVALGCGPQSVAADAEDAGTGVRKREVPPVRVAPVETRDMYRILETTSKLESEYEIEVFPRSSGVVDEVLAEEGDRVRAGTVLARMDQRDEVLAVRDAEVALEEARSTLALRELAVEDAAATKKSADQRALQAQRDYERDEQLAEETEVANPLSVQALEASRLARDQAATELAQAEIGHRRAQAEVLAAQNAIDRAQVALERAQLAAGYKEIRAPFDGVIAERRIRPGDMVSGSTGAFVLTDIDSLRAVFTRPQEELELFARMEGPDDGARGSGGRRLAITARAEAYPGRSFEGWVERISPTIEAESGQFRVTARIASIEGDEEHEAARLLPGMLVRMRIVTDRHAGALAVQKRALRREGARRYVLAVEPAEDESLAEEKTQLYTVRRVDVTEGYSDDDYVEIIPADPAALVAGTQIVLVGSRDLVDGQTVMLDRPREDGAAATELAPPVADQEATEDDLGEAGEAADSDAPTESGEADSSQASEG